MLEFKLNPSAVSCVVLCQTSSEMQPPHQPGAAGPVMSTEGLLILYRQRVSCCSDQSFHMSSSHFYLQTLFLLIS